MRSTWTKGSSLIVLFIGLTAGAAFGATAAKNGQTRETIPGTVAAAETYVTAGAGLALYDGATGWAINVGALHEVYPNFLVGADLGLNFFGSNTVSTPAASLSSSSTGIQLLPTAIYRFNVGQSRMVFPYIGLSVGPNVFLSKISSGANSTTGTRVLFEALLRPGIYTRVSDVVVLNVEGKLGLLDSNFIFLPQVNIVFSL